MKNIVTILRHVITPLYLLLFLVLGFTAAGLSGVVEFSVIKDLFVGIDGEKFNFLIPLIIVIVLEGLKLFLHYIVPAHQKHDKAGDAKAARHLRAEKITKWVLVFFSLLCTLIYVSNSLYKPETVREAKNTRIEEIEADYQTTLDSGIEAIEDAADESIKNAQEKVDNVRDQLEQHTQNPVTTPRAPAERYLAEKQRLEGELKTAQEKFDRERKDITDERDRKIEQLKKENSARMQAEIDAVAAHNDILISGDNAFLSSALTFFVSVFGQDEYNRLTYYLCVFCIALIVSAVLEIAISFAQYYLSLSGEQLSVLFSDTDESVSAEIKGFANRVITTVVRASIMVSVFLIYLALRHELPDDISFAGILPAFLSYMISIVVTSGSYRLTLNIGDKDEDSSDRVITGKSEAAKKRLERFYSIKDFLISVSVQMLICIVGFILLSAFFDSSLSNALPTTIALSVGSVGGQVILRQKAI